MQSTEFGIKTVSVGRFPWLFNANDLWDTFQTDFSKQKAYLPAWIIDIIEEFIVCLRLWETEEGIGVLVEKYPV